VLPKFINFEAK